MKKLKLNYLITLLIETSFFFFNNNWLFEIKKINYFTKDNIVTIRSKILNFVCKYSFGPFPINFIICSMTKKIVHDKFN